MVVDEKKLTLVIDALVIDALKNRIEQLEDQLCHLGVQPCSPEPEPEAEVMLGAQHAKT